MDQGNMHDLINALARLAEGAGLALQNRHDRRECESNLIYAKANLRYALELLGAAEEAAAIGVRT